MKINNSFDVIVVGGGVGGLITGCYLCKYGFKVLILEQHKAVGGYCGSFERGGYRFDIGVHYFGSLKKGILGQVLNDLKLYDQIKFNQIDPTDTIVLPRQTICIRSRHERTIEEFKGAFPNESAEIDEFFKYITDKSFIYLICKLRSSTFNDLLGNFFRNPEIIAAFNVLLGNIGINGAKASAIASVILFREYLFDPGYYPNGGIQAFPDKLMENFINQGGIVKVGTEVTKILVRNNKVRGVLSGKDEFRSPIVVSSVDAERTFNDLIVVQSSEREVIRKLIPSPSLFAVFIGLKYDFHKYFNNPSNFWVFPTYEASKYFSIDQRRFVKNKDFVFMFSFPSCRDEGACQKKPILEIFSIAPYATKEFWERYRHHLADKMITAVEAQLRIPLRSFIEIKFDATPHTFSRYTFNKSGAAFGWSSIVSQISPKLLPPKTSVGGLFLSGHWCTIGTGQGGVPKVAFCAKKVASLIKDEFTLLH